MNSIKRTARIAGMLWLLSTVTGGFGLFYIRNYVIESGDAAATAGNILASEFGYRGAIVGTLLAQLLLLFLGLTLFELFKEGNRRLAAVLLASALLTVGVAVVNTLNHFGALFVLSQTDLLSAFSREQLNALATVFIRLANGSGQALIEVFWAPYYFTLGLLILRSGLLPRVFGILLMIMGTGFAVNVLEKFLFPQFYPGLFSQLAMLGGALGAIPTMLWLLIRGARARSIEEPLPAHAAGVP
jgi:hypothetical protein